jgi:hypothetical protein
MIRTYFGKDSLCLVAMQRDAHGQTATCCPLPPYAASGNFTHANFGVSLVSLSRMEGGFLSFVFYIKQRRNDNVCNSRYLLFKTKVRMRIVRTH